MAAHAQLMAAGLGGIPLPAQVMFQPPPPLPPMSQQPLPPAFAPNHQQVTMQTLPPLPLPMVGAESSSGEAGASTSVGKKRHEPKEKQWPIPK